MIRLLRLIVVALLAAAVTPLASAQVGVDPVVPGKAMVRVASGQTIEAFLAVLNGDYPQIDAVAVDSIPARNLYLLDFIEPSAAVLDALESDLEITYPDAGWLVYGEFVYEGQAPEGHTGSTWVDGLATASHFANQYPLTLLGVNSAHTRSTGAHTVVAVLDTGIDATHPALAGRIATGGYNFIANNANTADAGDGADNDGDSTTDEMVGHGTYVAGLIALAAPGTKLLPVTVLNSDGVGSGWTFAKGMFHAIDRGVEVINLSLGSTYEALAVFDAIAEAGSRGIIVVAAAGNLNVEEPRVYPAMDDDSGVLGVAATNHNDIKASFSSYNRRLFISSPGDSVIGGAGGTNLAQSIVSATPGGGYGVWEGTSMSVAFVSAAAALVRSQHPEWPANAATHGAIRGLFASTAADIYANNPAYAKDEELGVGRINIGAAVAAGPVAPGPADLNGDGAVDVNDLLRLIGDWGLVHSSADINGDGHVDVNDLLILIGNWG